MNDHEICLDKVSHVWTKLKFCGVSSSASMHCFSKYSAHCSYGLICRCLLKWFFFCVKILIFAHFCCKTGPWKNWLSICFFICRVKLNHFLSDRRGMCLAITVKFESGDNWFELLNIRTAVCLFRTIMYTCILCLIYFFLTLARSFLPRLKMWMSSSKTSNSNLLFGIVCINNW